jgi:serine/threonine-protein kinase
VYGAESRFCSVDGATLVLEQPADDLVGTIVADRYHILERIGVGGMGQVFLAEHVRMKRKSALKIMREALTSDPIAVSRFHREAENASQINHPNVAAVYDFGETPNGLVYIAMEYIPGEPLSDVIEDEGALNPARVADIIVQAADALSAAHGLGILHRDLKPDNIMLTATRWGTDLVKLVDFGISRAMASATQQFTSTGMIVGTPDYMSPEQLTGDALDSRSDQYALALIAFFALTGTYAFPGGVSRDALLTRLTDTPRRLAEAKPDVAWPPALQDTLDRALAIDVQGRYADVLEFARELDAAIAGMPGTETMERYRDALRQRYTTPTRGPVVTPPRALPSLEITPVTPMPATEERAEVPEALVTAPTPAAPEAAAPQRAALGGRRRLAYSRARVLTAAGVTVGLVGVVVWQLAAAGPGTPTSSVPDSAAPDSVAPAPALGPAPSSLELLPAMPLDSVAKAARSGVFPLFAEGRQGSAFLVDPIGIVLTAAELVGGAVEPRLQLDPERRVIGRVMAVDAARGIAALRIPIQHCRACMVLHLTSDSALGVALGDSIVVPDAVTRRSAATEARGAITRAAGGAIEASLRLTDRAASGSPVLTTDRSVVALAMRRGARTELVAAEHLAKLRADAAERRIQVLPNDTLVPFWPVTQVARTVTAAARTRGDAELERYKVVSDGFELLAMTSQVLAWRAERIKDRVAGAQIMAIGDSPANRRLVDPIQRWSQWDAYVTERRAVVVLHVTPELAGYGKFSARAVVDLRQGDVGTMRLLRAPDTLVRPIEAALIPAVVNPEAYRGAGQHVYTAGLAVYHPREFARRADRRFPTLVVEVQDARRRRTIRIPLSEAALSAIERDLASFQR